MSEPYVGRVVISKAGRDKGKVFIIVPNADAQLRIEEGYVMIANGKERLLAKPKKKKLRHLAVTNTVFEALQAKLLGNLPVFDAEVRKLLAEYTHTADANPSDVETTRESPDDL